MRGWENEGDACKLFCWSCVGKRKLESNYEWKKIQVGEESVRNEPLWWVQVLLEGSKNTGGYVDRAWVKMVLICKKRMKSEDPILKCNENGIMECKNEPKGQRTRIWRKLWREDLFKMRTSKMRTETFIGC